MTDWFKLESNVPIPGQYPLTQMQVGQSFAADMSKRNSIRLAIARLHKGNTVRFATKVVTENDKQMLRVWRVK